MKRYLISLKDFNQARSVLQHLDTRPRPNGIACPTCGEELVDPTLHIILAGLPATVKVSCPNCNYYGYRLA